MKDETLYREYLAKAKDRGLFKGRLAKSDNPGWVVDSIRDIAWNEGITLKRATYRFIAQKAAHLESLAGLYRTAVRLGGEKEVLSRTEQRDLIYGDWDTAMERYGGYVSEYYQSLLKGGMTKAEASKQVSSDIFGSL